METILKRIEIIPLEFVELSDENSFCQNFEGGLNAAFLLSKLSEIQREIVNQKMAGFKLKEIAIKTSYPLRHISYELLKIRQTIRLLNP